jgi:hypothetical protein
MALRRGGLAALAVGVLALLGSACTPTPQMVLGIDVDSAATYEILTKVVTITVTLSCTRPHRVGMTASVASPSSRYLEPVEPYRAGLPLIVVDCPGPSGKRLTTKWRWGATTAPTGAVPVTVYGATEEYPGTIPAVDRATTSVTQAVTFAPILCWPGAPSCTSA